MLRHSLLGLACFGLCMGSAAPALAADGVFGLPAPGVLPPDRSTVGMMQFSGGAQMVSNVGTVGSVEAAFNGGLVDGRARLLANPANPLGFFLADVNVAYVADTGVFLPVHLMPFMGLGASMLMMQPATASTFTVGLPLYAPIGIRLIQPFGPVTVGGEISYAYMLGDILSGGADVGRWHTEVAARMGVLSIAVFNEAGPVLSGPGLRVGFNFGGGR